MIASLKRAIVHILDANSGVSVYSEEELDVTDASINSFITKHIEKVFEDASMRNAEFSENSEGSKRITLGVYVTDDYRDTVEDGIAIVKEYIESLAKDEKTKALVSMVLRLLARDAKGTLKASRIVQLRKVAMETGDERFMEGVRIIEESYQPEVSKQFIRAEIRDNNGMWKPIPLGMTES